MADRPNILIVITDQQSHHAMHCAGNEWLSTPAMDRLAARGARMNRAYCTYPLCSPVRASHMTGKYPHQVNVMGNEGKGFWAHEIAREELMGWHFSRAGYRCVWAGKDMPPADGSRDFELLCRWGDVQVADHVTDFLRDPGDKPFLGVVNFVNPHNICEWARAMPLWEGGIGDPPPERDLPPLPANHAVPAYEPEIIRLIQQWGMQIYLPRDFSQRQWRQYIWAYYRLIELVDVQLGRILDAMDQTGRAEDTLVIFMSDHGDGCGAHQWNQKQIFYEEIIRVPMILAGPGVEGPAVSDRLVSTGLDVLPTCCDAAGIDLPEGCQGFSLLELCAGRAPADWRESLVVESALNPEVMDNVRAARRNMGRCLVTDRWKYAAWKWGANREQLIDLENDPGEMHNLAQSSRWDPKLREMRRLLQDWSEHTDDPFQVPGHEILSPGATRQPD